MPSDVTTVSVSGNPDEYEDEHVHTVYDEIAGHFSSTRYKPWPIIAQFISSLPAGWVGLDSGTGNGKYLPLPLDRPGQLWTIGLDRSINLLRIAQTVGQKHREVVLGNVLDVPWRRGAFDYAISIATIHHLSTHERRKTAVKSLLQSISPDYGRALIYVWAMEQDSLSKRIIPGGQQTGETQVVTDKDKRGVDVFVPWVLKEPSSNRSNIPARHTSHQGTSPLTIMHESSAKAFNRFYHMFAAGELEQLVIEAAEDMNIQLGPKSTDSSINAGVSGIAVVQSGWERSNYYIELQRWRI
ncbi:S-adenosyl-L-methionine-dependent methyltransferase [Neolentinus lepideus HHB14362 ss-1]|uniref:S-adenosyl-L-methionine-dependent methyltransferase n=1 Tax=Neolentinus lepideus HHB14362 ss-1 TaxID=1314782 RepID=A0A165T7V7_9AGAM|nr:S-adenosyl-L-methionine-dependent methyltransferase [Neolentinus lepideus HHB14362 ss-1]